MNQLKFSLNDAGNAVTWRAEGLPTREREGGDFFRLMMDDGYYREMQVSSSDQTAVSVSREGAVTIAVYDGLVGTDGRRFDVKLTVKVEETASGLAFSAEIENRDAARVNEFEYPYVDLRTVASEDRASDVLCRPNGMGDRIPNPWITLAKSNSEYMSADYIDVKSTLTYPRPASMAWFGVESAGHFLYVGRHDPAAPPCCLLTALPPRGEEGERMALAICHYPFVKEGATRTVAPTVVSLSKGDFREGSKRYRAFAESAFYHPLPAPEWVKEMHGWQRIILRHQYGELFWKYEDLPRLYLEGKECGLDTLLVFGWWKGRFDNGYPKYEVDEELGGEEGLRNAIAEVQRLGGRVILYNNGILIDKKSDFYTEFGKDVARIDIDGNEYEDHYKFENNGTVLRNYGYKSFVHACQATDEWQRIMVENGKQKLSFGPDSIFYDQLGSRTSLCFNPAHKHGDDVAGELPYRLENVAACRALLGPDQAIGTECTNDVIVSSVHYIHGCDRGTFYRRNLNESPKGIFPAMFRHTFPETVVTNRFTHDCRKGFEDELNFAFLYGYRFDVSIYRGRRVGVKGAPAYEAQIRKLNALKDRYKEFFFGDGHYVYDTVPEIFSGKVWFGEHVAGDKHLMALANYGDVAASASVNGTVYEIEPHDVICVEM